MRRLFNDEDSFTDEAVDLSRLVYEALRPIVQSKIEAGVSIRDIEYVVYHEAGMLCTNLHIRDCVERRRTQKKDR